MSAGSATRLGTRGALDTLKIAEGPKDVARAARLAEAQGGKTRAILKLLGRGALLLTLGAFNFSWWMLRRGVRAVRFPRFDQGRHRADDPRRSSRHGAAAALRNARGASGADRPAAAAAADAAGGAGPAGLEPAAALPQRSPSMDRLMPSFHNGGVEIAYLDEGEGDPIVLVHGFASNKNVNWVYPTWVSELKKHGRRVIAFDHRGHGAVQQAVRSRGLSPRHAGRRSARADGSSRHRARRRDGLLDGRADHRVSRAQPAAAGALGDPRRARHRSGRRRRARRERREGAARRPRSTTWSIRSAAPSAPSPTRPAPIAPRSPPACAARGD